MIRVAAALFAASTVLIGCGGGGGAPASVPPPPPAPPPASGFVVPDAQFRVSAATPYAAGCDGGATAGSVFVNAEVEPHVAVNPRNRDNVIGTWQQDRWSGGAARGVLVAVSQDGARSWSLLSLPFTRCGGGTDERATDPWVSFGADGTAYVMVLTVSGRPFASGAASAMLVARSTDSGRTWTAPTTLIRDGVAAFNDKNTLTADPFDSRFAYAVWDRVLSGGNGPLMFARTVDGGASWEPPRAIFDPGAKAQTIGAVLAVLPNGALATVFTRLDEVDGRNVASLWSIRSEDRGTNWTAPVKLADLRAVGAFVPETRAAIRDGSVLPQMAAGPVGELYVVWQDARFSGGQIDAIALAKSLDGGLTWSTPARISTVANVQAITAQVHAARDGTVGVSYFDLRSDTADVGATTPTDYWLLRSRDGGTTWVESRIAGPFDLQRAPNANGLFIGDYHGLASIDTTFLSFFAQTTQEAEANRTDVFAQKLAPAAGASEVRSGRSRAALAQRGAAAADAFADKVSSNIARVLRARRRSGAADDAP